MLFSLSPKPRLGKVWFLSYCPKNSSPTRIQEAGIRRSYIFIPSSQVGVVRHAQSDKSKVNKLRYEVDFLHVVRHNNDFLKTIESIHMGVVKHTCLCQK